MSTAVQFTLFVGDLSIFCTEEDLHGAFEEFGDLLEVKIIRCEETKKNLSYGFIKFASNEGALRALDCRSGCPLCGRPLR
jgi:cold-inducible RNA-binding protein